MTEYRARNRIYLLLFTIKIKFYAILLVIFFTEVLPYVYILLRA